MAPPRKHPRPPNERGNISITGRTHARVREYCKRTGISASQLVERLTADIPAATKP